MKSVDASVPASVGPYRVLQLLGKGGMGRVYLAIDERLDRYVALKFLDGLSLQRRSLVFAEAKALAKLNHPSIVQIYDITEHEGQPILVMEYVEGEDLEKRVERQPMSPVSAVRVAISITSALVEAHYRSIVHSDLKLANILFSSAGVAKLTDFGIAQLLSLKGQYQPVKGSVTALSPEHISGAQVDSRADLFALGVVIYQMLSGKTPFEGAKTPGVYFKQLLYGSHPSLSILLPEVPEALSILVNQLLEKNPSMRPASATEVNRRLESIEIDLITDERDTLIFGPVETLLDEEQLPIEEGAVPRSSLGKRDFFNDNFFAAVIVVALFAIIGQTYVKLSNPDPIVVAVLLPTFKNPTLVSSGELLKTSFQQAVVDALVLVPDTHIIPLDEARKFRGGPSEIAQQLQVDEVLASYLDCVDVYCHAALRRYSQSGLEELADLRIPIDSYPAINTLVGKAARGLYPQPQQNWQ